MPNGKPANNKETTMATAKFYDCKKSRNIKCEVKSKYSTGIFEQQYYIAGIRENLMDTEVSRDEYESYDVPETRNERRDYLNKLEAFRNSGKNELPADWGKMPIEEQCGYLDGLLKAILDYDCDYSINVTLQWHGNGASAFVQFSDNTTCEYEPDYVRCNLVRRAPQLTLADMPESFKKWAYEFYGEEDVAESETQSVELVGSGETFSEAMEALFERIVLLFYGYECLYLKGDYEEYCRKQDGDGDDDDEWDDDDK